VISVFYDTRTAKEMSQALRAEGIDAVPITQGFQLHEAIKRTLGLIVAGELCHEHERDPVLTWMASNLVLLTNSKNERRIAKERAPEKIDGMAALVMGIEGALVRREREPEPVFQMIVVGGG
jgi:phage terminase large subunit-like protein